MSSFVPGNICTAVIANADILHNRIVVDGLVLRVVMDSLGLGNPLVLVRRGVILL